MIDNDLYFEFIEISGFLSYPPRLKQRIDLNTNRLTAIIGTIVDGSPGERNGAGKSGTIDALQYLYFGHTTRLANKGFVNYVERGPLLITGSARRAGISFYVERGENPSLLRLFEKPSDDPRDFKLYEDGKYVFETTKSTKPETSKQIIDLVGFDLKLTEILLVNNPSDKTCYFLKTQEEQRDIIERVFGFTMFTEKAKRLRELRTEENKNLATKESALIATRQANDRILAQIKDLEAKADEWAVNRDRMIKLLTQQIKSYEKIDFDHDEQVLRLIGQIEHDIGQIKRDAQTAEQTLSQTQTRYRQWGHKHDEEVTSLTQTIAVLSQADAAQDIETLKTRELLRQALFEVEAQIGAVNTALIGLRRSRQSDLNSTKLHRERVDVLEANIIKLSDEKCPTCGQDWVDNADHMREMVGQLERVADALEKAELQIDELSEQITNNEHLLDQYEVHHRSINEKTSKLSKTTFRTIEEATSAAGRIEEFARKLTDIESQQNPYEETLTDAATKLTALRTDLTTRTEALDMQKKLSTTSFRTISELEENRRNFETITRQFAEHQQIENPYRDTIHALRTQAFAEVDETEIKALKNRIDHMSLLITLLADKDSPIRKTVLNEWLPELNMRVNRHLQFLELPHRLTFDADMTVSFALPNVDAEPGYGNLSAGQQLRARLAVNRAFREIFELINFRINLFFVDEVLDKGMDERGALVSYQFLEEMVREDKSIFLITHRIELADMAEHVLHVDYKDKLTTLRNTANP